MKKYYDIVNQATSQSTQYNVYLQGEKPVYDPSEILTESMADILGQEFVSRRYRVRRGNSFSFSSHASRISALDVGAL